MLLFMPALRWMEKCKLWLHKLIIISPLLYINLGTTLKDLTNRNFASYSPCNWKWTTPPHLGCCYQTFSCAAANPWSGMAPKKTLNDKVTFNGAATRKNKNIWLFLKKKCNHSVIVGEAQVKLTINNDCIQFRWAFPDPWLCTLLLMWMAYWDAYYHSFVIEFSGCKTNLLVV